MKKLRTEMVFILDRSGSMAGLEEDTIGGFNSMLKKQSKLEGEAKVTTILFDDKYELLHDRFDIREVKNLSNESYFVRGSTALLDAIGKTIDKMVAVQKNQTEEARADKVIFIIITDGMENASSKYSYSMIRQLITHEEKKFGWEFIFMGANIDAEEEAAKIGIKRERAANYNADSKGTDIVYASMDKVITESRNGIAFNESWKMEIESDHKNRKSSR